MQRSKILFFFKHLTVCKLPEQCKIMVLGLDWLNNNYIKHLGAPVRCTRESLSSLLNLQTTAYSKPLRNA